MQPIFVCVDGFHSTCCAIVAHKYVDPKWLIVYADSFSQQSGPNIDRVLACITYLYQHDATEEEEIHVIVESTPASGASEIGYNILNMDMPNVRVFERSGRPGVPVSRALRTETKYCIKMTLLENKLCFSDRVGTFNGALASEVQLQLVNQLASLALQPNDLADLAIVRDMHLVSVQQFVGCALFAPDQPAVDSCLHSELMKRFVELQLQISNAALLQQFSELTLQNTTTSPDIQAELMQRLASLTLQPNESDELGIACAVCNYWARRLCG